MSQNERFVYQIVAAHRDRPEVSVARARLGYKPFHIGSGSSVDLRLESALILPAHARLFLTTAGQVMLTNLGAPGTVTLNDTPLSSFTCAHWKPGAVMSLGEYELHLVTLVLEGESGRLEHIRPSVITQENAAVVLPEEIVPSVSPAPPGAAVPAPSEPDEAAPPNAAGSALGSLKVRLEDRSTPTPWKTDGHNSKKAADRSPGEAVLSLPAASPALGEIFHTPVMPFAYGASIAPAASAAPVAAPAAPAAAPAPARNARRPPSVMGTLPKDWHYAGQLGAQLPVNPVNLVAGERVRVPISIRNDYADALQVGVFVTGVPQEWVILPGRTIAVAPGEIGTFDLILRTQSPAPASNLELKVRLSSRASSTITLMLPLQLNFKREPDLVGSLDPAEARGSSRVHLCLQNHTQARAQVFIAGHAAAADLHVIPTQTQVDLPPGQTVRIPISFQFKRRPWLHPACYTFSVSAVQGSRAPLDYPGTLWVRPHLPLLSLALLRR